MSVGLVYIGKIISIDPIPGADFIGSATVVCGAGGKWRGVVRKDQFADSHKVIVYLPDSIIPENEEMQFMKASKWRVKMRMFKGAPSEVVIMPYTGPHEVGFDITPWTGVIKYIKSIPAHLAGIAKGDFPGFLRKTDEPNWQRVPQAVEILKGNPYYITEKADGSSTTAYKWRGDFGVCSRNLELVETENNGYWKVANKYNLREPLPEGFALQWETCGPGIQKNPMGLSEIDGRAFSLYNISTAEYEESHEFIKLCKDIKFPTVNILETGDFFNIEDLNEKAKGKYSSGKTREGIVIRSARHIEGKTVSFKAINLEYEE